ncbi:MAG: hypothetical protein EOM12_05290 [Verrucomicrobiae bacterium]|nr:hypothetical protein [Verrucomicrobiae bacterium]
MSTPYKKIENPVFQFLCDQIVSRECVPFLGSGVSYDCNYAGKSKSFNSEENKVKGHTTDGLKKRFADKDKSLGELCEHFLWTTNKSDSDSLRDLVNKLMIHEFIHLEPTQAHQIIALLVREGLLPQIITTNYDTALEKAICKSFGDNGDNCSECRHNECKSVVHDQKTCSHQKPGKQGSGDRLHLYKINGCAQALVDDNNKPENERTYHQKILLTMRQLQAWRERRWAKDTFRVVLRSNTILFSGFGSDEPQVLHTVHQVLDEYSSFIDGSYNLGDNLCDLPPNTPVIHSLESEPSYCHRQIANNFIQSVAGQYNSEAADKLILRRNSDGIPKNSDNKLTADDFWLLIFQETQHRLVSEIIAKAINGQLAVSGLPGAKHEFDDIHKAWNKADSSLIHLLAKKDDSCWQTDLSHLLSCLLNDGSAYEPLNRRWNVTAELIFYMHTLNKNIDNVFELKKIQNADAHILMLDKSCLVGRRLSVGSLDSEQQFDSSIATFVLSADLSNDHSLSHNVRVQISVNGEGRRRTPVRLTLFTLRNIIDIASDEYRKTAWRGYEHLMQNMASYPSKWRAKLSKTKRERYMKETA